MAELFNKSSVYTPKTMFELVSVMAKNPNAMLFGGGTDILSNPKFSNGKLNKDFILTSQVAELQKVTHGERYLEVGGAVTIQQLLNTGAIFLSDEVRAAISNIASSMLRSQITVGGALFTSDGRFELPVILSAIGATCEVRILTRRGRDRTRVRTSSRWLPVGKLYEDDGSLVYTQDVILTRVRIPASSEKTQIFKTLSDPKHKKDQAVMFAFQYTMGTGILINPLLCIAFPNVGMITQFDSQITSVSLPVKVRNLEEAVKILRKIIKDEYEDVTDIQLERVCRLYRAVVYRINLQYLAG